MESFGSSTAEGNEVSLDVYPQGFWQSGQMTFFDASFFKFQFQWICRATTPGSIRKQKEKEKMPLQRVHI